MRALLPLILAGCCGLFACEGTVGALGAADQLPSGGDGAPLIQEFSCTPLTVPATVNASCDAVVTDPNGRPLSCTLTTSDGRTVVQGVDCANFSQPVAFPTPGPAQVTLTAVNDTGGSAQQTVSLTVNVRPNFAPTIASFAASPALGTVPFNTDFVWSASDPDGDPLTCDVDVGDDGTVDFPGLDCALGTQAYAMAAAGAVTVRLTVNDGLGGTATATTPLTGRMPVGDVALSSIDWGQTLVSGNLRLVGNKGALLRAHVLGSKSGIAGVVVQAEGFSAAGTSLGTVNLTGPASPPTADAPGDLTQQYLGEVPAGWVQPGFSVKVHVDPANALAETDETNNDATVTPTVGKANVLHLESVPVTLSGTTAATPDLTQTMTRLWPLQSIDNVTRAPYNGGSIPGATDTNAWGNLLQDLAAVRSADGSTRDYYGFLHLNYQSGIAGLGYIGQPITAIGRDDSTFTAAHELGHNMGRQHAPCGGAASPDPSYPYAGADIGKLGYDWFTQALVAPGQYTDLMGYCQPAWVSDYNYLAVQSVLETQNLLAQGPAMYAPALLVRGSADVDGQVTLRPVLPMRAALSQEGDASEWTLELDFGDRVVERTLSLAPVQDGDGAQHFTALVADPGGLTGLKVSYLGKVVARRSFGAPREGSATVVRDDARHQARLRWDASQWPIAALAHFDGAGRRTTLALELTSGDATVELGDLKGGWFEVSLAGPQGFARLEVR